MKFIMSMIVTGMMLFSAGCVNAGLYDHPLVGKKAPDFKLTYHKGGEASLEGLRKDGSAVIFFWATWCPHCREQINQMDAQRSVLEKMGAAVILVDIGESPAVVEKFLAAKKYDINVLLDKDSSVAEAYQVVGVPTIVLIGADGSIRDISNVFPENYAQLLK